MYNRLELRRMALDLAGDKLILPNIPIKFQHVSKPTVFPMLTDAQKHSPYRCLRQE
jgi:hypothetical protein